MKKERKIEMEGEALYNRAQAYLYLLRQYGEFFNRSSSYGIVILPNNEPITDNTPIKRATVEKSYEQILNDLNEAIAKAPTTNVHHKVSRITAKALKARVLLYMKEFGAASTLATEVLNEASAAGYGIEEDFKDMFKNSFESKEMLFALYSMYPEESFEDELWMNFEVGNTTSKIATSILPKETDKRYLQTFRELDEETPFIKNNKYHYTSWQPGKQGSFYFIRLAEMYYIIAEAQTRLENFDAARKALKEIICIPRAGYPKKYVDETSNTNLLKTILHQKWMELTTENNEEWFDLVRYHAWDNYAITPYYIESDTHLLLPIPRKARQGNSGLEQNPSYKK